MSARAREGFATPRKAWNELNAASVTNARIAFGQLELASLTNRFMAQRADERRAETAAH